MSRASSGNTSDGRIPIYEETASWYERWHIRNHDKSRDCSAPATYERTWWGGMRCVKCDN